MATELWQGCEVAEGLGTLGRVEHHRMAAHTGGRRGAVGASSTPKPGRETPSPSNVSPLPSTDRAEHSVQCEEEMLRVQSIIVKHVLKGEFRAERQ